MTRVHIVGDDLPALAAALELAEVGIRISVERRESTLPEGPELDHDGALAALMERVAEPIAEGGHRHDAASPTSILPRPLLLRSSTGAWLPAPEPSVQGVPVTPLARECFALLGTSRTLRAYLDRIKPLLTIGKTHEYGPLVQARIGEAARLVLVEPVIRERFGRSSDGVDVAIVAPGLNEALSRAGSLTGAALAYVDRNVARETRVMPRGGWEQLRDTLLERLAHYGATIVSGGVKSTQRDDGSWQIELEDGERFHADAVVATAGTRFGEAVELLPRDASSESARLQIRVTVDVGSDVDAEVGADRPSLDQLADHDALETVEIDGEDWSVRTARRAKGGLSAIFTGPVLERAVDAAGTSRIVERVLSELELVGSGVAAGHDSSVTAWWRAAPFATRDERTAAESRVAALREQHETLVPVGASLHGGDLSAALRSAREESVELRRHLLGLTD
ncbi:FAD-dependent oxidoreductase [Leucobacter sp. GX24907]